jgi:hypothetical protein
MRRGAAWVAAGVAALAVTVPADAQDLARLRHRVDSLVAIAESARRAVDAFDDSLRASRPAIDSIVIHPLIVAFEPELAGLMRDVVPRVTGSLTALFGDALRNAATQRYVLRAHQPSPSARNRGQPFPVIISATSPAGKERTSWRNSRDPDEISHALRAAAVGTVLTGMSGETLVWMGNHAPTDSVTSSEWAEHRLQLVSSPTSVGALCHSGDLHACRLALLISSPRDEVLDWFDAPTRRRLVTRNRAMADQASPRAAGECEAGSDSSCVWVLQHAPPGMITEPVPAAIRLGLARFAVALGGDGALQRFVTAAPGVEQRLAAAANAPLDTVLSRWNRRIRETRLPSHNIPPLVVVTAVLWVGALGALSLRSTRWR